MRVIPHKANGEKAHKYRLCRHLQNYIGLVKKLFEVYHNNVNLKKNIDNIYIYI